MKRSVLHGVSLMLVCVLCLSSCASLFGTSDYSLEDVTGTVSPDSAVFEELEDMLGMLTVNSADIPEFDSMKDAIDLFRDSLLNYMAGKNYSKYAGNSALIDMVAEKYPELEVIEVIPMLEFESEMYRYFGGSVKITHKDGRLFRYLDDADVYVAVTGPVDSGVDIELTEVQETANTYRLSFACSTDEVSIDYFAVVVKRDDGTLYFDAVVKK